MLGSEKAIDQKKRLEWALEHRQWTVEQWNKVLWSDESPFTLRYGGKARVWRLPNERYDTKCLQGTVKHDKKINVWGGFAANGVGCFRRIIGIMKKKMYLEILEDSMVPSGNKLFPEGKFIYQRDNDPKHAAGVVRD